MKCQKALITLVATGLFLYLISIPLAVGEGSPPPSNVDPGSETPTNPSLAMETTYDHSIHAEEKVSDNDDSPGFEISLIIGTIVTTTLMIS